MGILAKPSRQERSQTTLLQERNLFCQIDSATAEMETVTESRGFEDLHQEQHPRSNERRNGVVGTPPALTPGADQDGSPNERRRRNGIAGAPFIHAFLASPQYQTDDSRSR